MPETTAWSQAYSAFYHLATEEDAFEKYGYEGRERHVRQHNAFRKRIQAFREEIDAEGVEEHALLRKLVTFASEWLKGHIAAEDRKCTEIFKKVDQEM